MTDLATKINTLLEPEIAAPGDGSLLDSALGGTPASAEDLAYSRVEILLAAWVENVAEIARLREMVNAARAAREGFEGLPEGTLPRV